VDQQLLAGNEYLATVREHQSAFQLVFQDAVFAERATLGELVIAWVAGFSPRLQPFETVIMARPRAAPVRTPAV
jgi:hypothetical protein